MDTVESYSNTIKTLLVNYYDRSISQNHHQLQTEVCDRLALDSEK